MNKINFVNNQEPAISAENLNQMQNNMEEVGVAISPTEPTTNENVWIQKGKNLYNKNKTYTTGVNSQNISLTINELIVGEKYTFYANEKPFVQVLLYDKSNNLLKEYGNTSSSTIVNFEIINNCAYCILSFYVQNNVNIKDYDFTNVMLLNGQYSKNNLPDYEAYIDKKIIVNGEKFLDVEKANNQQNYSTEEQVIGTWIDG